MDFTLAPEQEQLVEMVRDFARTEIARAQESMAGEKAFPYECWRKWSDLGMAGILLPEEYGGAGLDALTYVLCLEEVATVSQTFAILWQIHVVVSTMYATLGTTEQKSRWLADFAAGRKMPSFALTEDGAGSDAGGLKTTAQRRDDGSWVLNGRKVFASNVGSDLSDGTVVMAVTGQSAGGRPQISSFIVPRATPGFRLGQSFPKMAWHGIDNRELLLDDVTLPPDALLGPEGRGLKQALSALNIGRIAIATLGCALARACLDEALAHSRQRQQFGQPLSAFQITQVKLANMATRTKVIRSFIHQTAWEFAQGRDIQTEAAMAKLLASQFAVLAATDAYQLHGGYGFMTDARVNRLYREAQILEIGEGTSEVLQLMIARALGC